MIEHLPRLTIDFETKSDLDIKDTGPWIYSQHPSTELLCLSYRFPNGSKGFWKRGDPPPKALFRAIEETFLPVEAHNSFFELCIWANVCVKKMGWPEIPLKRFMCSAAKAAMHALPRTLGGAGEAMGLKIQKDKMGKLLLNKLSVPQKPRKDDSRIWITEDQTQPVKVAKDEYMSPQELFTALYSYNEDDTATEEELSKSLDDLPPIEQNVWQLDQKVNWRGFYIDRELCEAAVELLSIFETKSIQAITDLTSGYVDKPTKRAAILEYCYLNDVELPDLRAGTIDRTLEDKNLCPHIRKLLILRQQGSKSSAKKFAKFLEMADVDDIVRSTLMYHGASTGRWTGKGVQTQNMIRGIFKSMEEVEECIALIKARDVAALEEKYENPVEAISSVGRSVITARPGYELFCADYSAIEARVLVWLAKDDKAVGFFRDGKDVYIDMAQDIYGLSPAEYDEKPQDKKDFMRWVGKNAILGLGYGMGAPRYKDEAFVKGDGLVLSEAFCKKVVDKYRTKYSKIVKLWAACEKAAIHAVKFKRTAKKPCTVGYVKYYMHNGFLCCELPSGRKLYYHRPKVLKYQWYGNDAEKLEYWGVNPVTKQYSKTDTYGGHLVENICQAIARDIMAHAALIAWEKEYYILTTVHDEILTERTKGKGSVEEFENILTTLPEWAKGCPIDAEGWKGERYRK